MSQRLQAEFGGIVKFSAVFTPRGNAVNDLLLASSCGICEVFAFGLFWIALILGVVGFAGGYVYTTYMR